VSCCTPAGYRTIFGAGAAERDARRYRRRGLVGSARWLRDRLAAGGLASRSVLEVGGGVGGLQIELVLGGADHATNVEIVDTYEDAALGLIAEHALDGRIVRQVGDFAVRPDEAPAADIVVLHRVVCCYDDPDALVAAACARSRDRIALTLPRDSWLVRLGFAAENAWYRARRVDFRVNIHPRARILELAAAEGFQPADTHRDMLWSSIILARTPATTDA
jgi:magnesium-protoporphyrin O-methyltransferase